MTRPPVQFVSTAAHPGDWFRTTVRARQGCLFSPTLSTYSWKESWLTPLKTVSIGGRAISNLHCADDVDGLAGTETELISLVERIDKTSTAYSMQISAENNKLMTNNTNVISSNISVSGEKLESAQSFKY